MKLTKKLLSQPKHADIEELDFVPFVNDNGEIRATSFKIKGIDGWFYCWITNLAWPNSYSRQNWKLCHNIEQL